MGAPPFLLTWRPRWYTIKDRQHPAVTREMEMEECNSTGFQRERTMKKRVMTGGN